MEVALKSVHPDVCEFPGKSGTGNAALGKNDGDCHFGITALAVIPAHECRGD
jgi:hypothetical protein